MQIEVAQTEQFLEITIDGRIDATTVGDLESRALEEISNHNLAVLLNFANHRKGTKWISKKLFKRGFTKAGLYFYARHLYIKVKQKGLIGTLLFRSNTRS